MLLIENKITLALRVILGDQTLSVFPRVHARWRCFLMAELWGALVGDARWRNNG